MKVLLLGHSYVKYLERLGDWDREVKLDSGESLNLEFSFRSQAGKDYDHFLTSQSELEFVDLLRPDIIVVILGGNSITTQVTNSEIKWKSTEFFIKLNEVISDQCLKLVVQVEPRNCEAGNKFGTPEFEEFNRRRAIINNHYNTTLKKRKLVDHVVLLGSLNFLQHPSDFSDGVHLNINGLNKYKDTVVGALLHALNNRK